MTFYIKNKLVITDYMRSLPVSIIHTAEMIFVLMRVTVPSNSSYGNKCGSKGILLINGIIYTND